MLESMKAAANETTRLLNEEIPRPSLNGVTPAVVRYIDRHLITGYRIGGCYEM